jgi:energy-converting hydrogenase Eha subunit G
MVDYASLIHPTRWLLALIDAGVCAVVACGSTSRLGGDEVDIRGLRMAIND